MKAIILAAGEGKRLRPLTADRPKCMVQFRGKPLIEYQIETLHQFGIHDIIVVKGYKAEALKCDGVRFVMNPIYDRSNMVHSLFCAESEMTDDLLISYGDIIYDARVLGPLLESRFGLAIAVFTKWKQLWEQRLDEPLKDLETLKLNEDKNVIELGMQPKSYDEIQGQYMGLIKISLEMLNTVKAFYHSMDRQRIYRGYDFMNMYMTTFLQCLIDSGLEVASVAVSGSWLEIDSLSDLELPFDGM